MHIRLGEIPLMKKNGYYRLLLCIVTTYSRIISWCIEWKTMLLHATTIRLPCIPNTFGILKQMPQIDGWIISVLQIQSQDKIFFIMNKVNILYYCYIYMLLCMKTTSDMQKQKQQKYLQYKTRVIQSIVASGYYVL